MDQAMKLKLYSFTLDCKNPRELANFYSLLLGWEMPFWDEDYAVIAPPGAAQGAYPGLTFQRNPAYEPPVWPETPGAQQQMAHLDFAVMDLDKAVSHAIQCGATAASAQFSDRWRVMLDPAGHPFCLCLLEGAFTAVG